MLASRDSRGNISHYFILTFAESPAAGIWIVSGLCPNSLRLNNSTDANYNSSQDYNDYQENVNISNSENDHKDDPFETVQSTKFVVRDLTGQTKTVLSN